MNLVGEFLTGVGQVLFNGVPASFDEGFGGLNVVATVPAGASSGPITVITSSGTNTTETSFTVTAAPPPEITGFVPSSGAVGQRVSISGRNLSNATAVQFNGVSASFDVYAGAISAVVPEGAGTGPIRIITPDGVSTTAEVFSVTVAGAPALTSVSPERGRPGTQVSITGENLGTVLSVQFNGQPASFDVFGFLIIAMVPAEASTGPITISTSNGSVQSPAPFTVLDPSTPEITGFTPKFAAAGQPLKITGTNFVEVTEVRIGGVSTSFTVVSASEITAMVPAEGASGPVTVTAPVGTGVSRDEFLFPARVLSMEPGHGPPGTVVIIRGLNFTDTIAVLFAGESASFTNLSATELRAVVPEGTTSGTVSVFTPAGFGMSPGPFYLPPTVTGFNPRSGLPGSEVTVSGENLVGATRVTFAGLEAAFTVISLTTLVATVPAEATSGPIAITTPAGSATSSEIFLSGLFSDVALSVSVSAGEVSPGDFLLYSIAVTNNGPLEAQEIVVTDVLPEDVTLVFPPSGVDFTQTKQALTCRLGTLPAGFGTSFKLATLVSDGSYSYLTNQSSVTSSGVDGVPANNSVTLVTPRKGAPPLETIALDVKRAGQAIEIAWPASASAFVLESTSSLVPPVTWTLANTDPQVVNGQAVLRLDLAPGNRFYRLRKPADQ